MRRKCSPAWLAGGSILCSRYSAARCPRSAPHHERKLGELRAVLDQRLTTNGSWGNCAASSISASPRTARTRSGRLALSVAKPNVARLNGLAGPSYRAVLGFATLSPTYNSMLGMKRERAARAARSVLRVMIAPAYFSPASARSASARSVRSQENAVASTFSPLPLV